MMIRINLLPVRQVKKRELGRQVLVLIGVVAVLALVVNYLWYDNRDSEKTRKEAQIAATQQRIAELEKVIGEVNNINKRKKEVEDKLKILNDLRKGRSGPVRLLDALATATPKKVWLSQFTEQNNAVILTGQAVSHDDVAEFMRSLGNIVWTPKGMGRLVEQKRDAKTGRVELLTSDGAIEDFPASEIGSFFTNIDLKKAETGEKSLVSANKRINFEIQLAANYSL
jgi:type IV pilus assembly protein PilN